MAGGQELAVQEVECLAWWGRGRTRSLRLGARSSGAAVGSWTAGSVSVRPVEGGWGQAEAVFAKITKWQISVGLGSRVA